MKFRCTIFILLLLPVIVLSQPIFKNKKSPGAKVSVKKAAKYYLKKRHIPSPEFSIYYNSLFSGLQGYTSKDTLLANKVINRLYQFNDVLFFRLMRIRLEWEFNNHLNKSLLDSLLPLCKNNNDSANYSYMLGIYFEDSLYVRFARKFGFVRAFTNNIEFVDWKKIRTLRFNQPSLWENISIDDLILPISDKINNRKPSIAHTAILFYESSFKYKKSEFYYLKELLIFLSKIREENKIHEIISSHLKDYNKKEKRWLRKRLTESYERQELFGDSKSWIEQL